MYWYRLISPSAKNRWSMVLSLLFATVMRTFLVVISYGCKVPAGIFVPSMAIGASFGRMIGILVEALHASFPGSRFFAACEPDIPCITPGTYAFLGAGAALSGIMHITVSVVVIMFELTGALTYILPTMVSTCFLSSFSTLPSEIDRLTLTMLPARSLLEQRKQCPRIFRQVVLPIA